MSQRAFLKRSGLPFSTCTRSRRELRGSALVACARMPQGWVDFFRQRKLRVPVEHDAWVRMPTAYLHAPMPPLQDGLVSPE